MREYLVAANASIADLELRSNAVERAADSLQAARQAAAEIGSRDQLAELGRCQALLALKLGDIDQALEAAHRALNAAQEEEDAAELGLCLRVLGQVLAEMGNGEQAQRALAESTELLAGRPYEAARSLAALGQLRLRAGEAQVGRAQGEQARATFIRLGATQDLAEVEQWLGA